jgi:polyisoprenoid-binding protein YceI
MKYRSLLAGLFLLFGFACRESVVDTKPAAEVTATSATAASTEPTPGAVTAKVIKEKSAIEFVGAKVTRDHDGKFHNFDGWIEYANAKPTRVSFDIDLTTIEADDPKLTQHLKSPDFFDVAKYPKATFTSTSLTEAPAGAPGGTTHELRGILDMHGVKKEVSIPVKAEVTPDGVRTTSEFTINRHDWGISYRGAADDLIKDNVLMKLDLSFPPPPAA